MARMNNLCMQLKEKDFFLKKEVRWQKEAMEPLEAIIFVLSVRFFAHLGKNSGRKSEQSHRRKNYINWSDDCNHNE